MDSDAETALLRYVRQSLVRGRKTITADTALFERKFVDSINILKLIGYIERVRGRRLRADDLVMSNFRSVRTIARRFLDVAR
jgi:acyl carrier protein